MANKRFLVSVSDAVVMQGNDIIAVSKTLADSSISIETSNTEIRGGVSNPLQAVFYHSGTFNLTLTETQFSLPFIAANVGTAITNGGEIWTNETVTLEGQSGTITGTAAAIDGQVPAVWVEHQGTHYTLPLTDKTFSVNGTSIAQNSTICVMYLDTKNSAKQIIVPANIIPDRVRIYLIANLYGDVSGSGFIGNVQIEIPVAQLSGAQEISMTADGYSNTPLTAMALAYSDSNAVGCDAGQYYAKIVQFETDANWYDGVTGLAIQGGDFTLNGPAGTKATLRVYAVRGNDSFLCDNSLLTFTSGTVANATVGENTGVVTSVANGTSLITVKITGKEDIEGSCTVTVEGIV